MEMKMTKRKLAALALAILVVPTAACDREDKRDVKEIGREVGDEAENVEKEVDKLDKDGKDD